MGLASSGLFAQSKSLPDIEFTNLDGHSVHIGEILKSGGPLLMVFWKSNDNECCEQLMMINEMYEDHLMAEGIKVIGICLDCAGQTQHVKPFIHGHDISFEVYIDKNGDFRRAMNVPDVPYTVLFDSKMNVICRRIGTWLEDLEIPNNKQVHYLTESGGLGGY